MPSDFFKDRVAIVTGASSGIGEAAARLLHKRGAKVVLAARRQALLDRLAAGLPGSIAVPTDVTRPAEVERLVRQTLEKFGRVDLLVNNAGLLLYKPMPDSSIEEVRAVMETNFFGCVLCAHAVLPAMRRQRSGCIVNVASIAGRIGFPNLGYYGASKFALVGFSETLRQEVKRAGIHVSTVCPGTVRTPMTEELIRMGEAQGKRVLPIAPETVARAILDAAERRRTEVFLPKATHVLYLLHFFLPRFVEWLAWKFRAGDSNDLVREVPHP